MEETPAVESLDLLERVALLALADAADNDETPVASLTVKERCETLLEHVDADVISNPTEAELMRTLGALGAEPYVREAQSSSSPTGKGRPTYALDAAPDPVLAALDSDERLTQAVEYVRSR